MTMTTTFLMLYIIAMGVTQVEFFVNESNNEELLVDGLSLYLIVSTDPSQLLPNIKPKS